jgi:hypothetical protein
MVPHTRAELIGAPQAVRPDPLVLAAAGGAVLR